jgi:tRNA (guanine-N7-)-methyltransferase
MGTHRPCSQIESGFRLSSPQTAAASEGPGQRLLYGRRQGRRLRAGRQAALDSTLPDVTLALPDGGGTLERAFFKEPVTDVGLEIGFGAGEHLVWQAEAHPGMGWIGCEPYRHGVASLLARWPAVARGRLRVVVDDARVLLAALPDDCIGRAFVLFPDPWPKKRHHRRRVVQTETLRQLARVLRPGAELRMATDDVDYGRWILARALAEPKLEWLAERADDWRSRGTDWPETRYETKALAAGRKCLYLRFRRRPG